MGAITGLLGGTLFGPLWGVRFVLERLRDEVDAERFDERRAFAELIELNMRRNTGELSDAEYADAEAQLLERLNSIREQQDEPEYEVLDTDGEMVSDVC